MVKCRWGRSLNFGGLKSWFKCGTFTFFLFVHLLCLSLCVKLCKYGRLHPLLFGVDGDQRFVLYFFFLNEWGDRHWPVTLNYIAYFIASDVINLMKWAVFSGKLFQRSCKTNARLNLNGKSECGGFLTLRSFCVLTWKEISAVQSRNHTAIFMPNQLGYACICSFVKQLRWIDGWRETCSD